MPRVSRYLRASSPSGWSTRVRWYSADASSLARCRARRREAARRSAGVSPSYRSDTPDSLARRSTASELQVLDLSEEPDGVAPGPAPEAVIDLLRRRHREGRGLLGVERAQADDRVVSGLLQGQVAGDQLHQVGPLPDRLDVFLPDPSSHHSPSAYSSQP